MTWGSFCPPGLAPEQFPACESLTGDRLLHDEAAGDRLRLLKMLLAPERPRLVATSIQALLQPVPDHEALARQTRLLRVGQRLSLEELARWLVENRFHPTTGVELPGEFSLRGGIVDIFAPDWYEPVRHGAFGRRDRVDPPLRGLQPAEPGKPRGSGSDRAGAAVGRPRTFRRFPAAGKLVPAGRAGRVGHGGDGITWSGWSGRRSCTRWPTCCGRCSASPR